MSLYLRYHPKTLDAVVGHDATVKIIKRILEKSDREAFWFSGPSGCGKTSLAQAIANAKCDDKRDIIQVEGTKCGVDVVDDIARHFQFSTWGASLWKACIVNEAHKITDRAVDAWLTLLDPDADGGFVKRRLVIFTSTESCDSDLFGNSTSPFARRCKSFNLKPDLQVFAEYAKHVADGEELNAGWGVEKFLAQVKHRKGSLGAILQDIEAGMFMEEPSCVCVDAKDRSLSHGKTSVLPVSSEVSSEPAGVGVGVSEFDAALDELIGGAA